MCVPTTVYNRGTQYSTALNSSDNLPSHAPGNHHSTDDVYGRGGGLRKLEEVEEREKSEMDGW